MEKDGDRYQDEVLNSHALDMIALYDSSTVDAEMEADVIRGVLDSNGIPSLVMRPGPYPAFGYQVMVPRGKVVLARQLLEEARMAGAEAAAEAEQDSEKPQ